jgi:hypothetical protein
MYIDTSGKYPIPPCKKCKILFTGGGGGGGSAIFNSELTISGGGGGGGSGERSIINCRSQTGFTLNVCLGKGGKGGKNGKGENGQRTKIRIGKSVFRAKGGDGGISNLNGGDGGNGNDGGGGGGGIIGGKGGLGKINNGKNGSPIPITFGGDGGNNPNSGGKDEIFLDLITIGGGGGGGGKNGGKGSICGRKATDGSKSGGGGGGSGFNLDFPDGSDGGKGGNGYIEVKYIPISNQYHKDKSICFLDTSDIDDVASITIVANPGQQATSVCPQICEQSAKLLTKYCEPFNVTFKIPVPLLTTENSQTTTFSAILQGGSGGTILPITDMPIDPTVTTYMDLTIADNTNGGAVTLSYLTSPNNRVTFPQPGGSDPTGVSGSVSISFN